MLIILESWLLSLLTPESHGYFLQFQACYCVVLIEKLVSPPLRSIFGLNIYESENYGKDLGEGARN